MSPAAKRTTRVQRTSAEWTTFGIAVVILLVVMAAILMEALQSHDKAQPVAKVERTERVGDGFQVHVLVENEGDLAASNVQVNASLDLDGDTTDSDQVVDFLAGGDDEELVFVFADDPSSGVLTVEVNSFTIP